MLYVSVKYLSQEPPTRLEMTRQRLGLRQYSAAVAFGGWQIIPDAKRSRVSCVTEVCRLEACDTADWKSAVQVVPTARALQFPCVIGKIFRIFIR
jgi:hypothetical protein